VFDFAKAEVEFPSKPTATSSTISFFKPEPPGTQYPIGATGWGL